MLPRLAYNVKQINKLSCLWSVLKQKTSSAEVFKVSGKLIEIYTKKAFKTEKQHTLWIIHNGCILVFLSRTFSITLIQKGPKSKGLKETSKTDVSYKLWRLHLTPIWPYLDTNTKISLWVFPRLPCVPFPLITTQRPNSNAMRRASNFPRVGPAQPLIVQKRIFRMKHLWEIYYGDKIWQPFSHH